MNDADFAMLKRMELAMRDMANETIRALRAELERVVIDNHLLREENERLRRQRPEEQR